MGKRIALKDYIEVDGVDLSTFARAVTPNLDSPREDVSGFNPTGGSEFLAGTKVHEVTVEFFGSYGASEVHATVYPIYRDGTTVSFKWYHDSTTGVSSTNPDLRGNVSVFNYSPTATRGSVETFSVTFVADADGLVFNDAS